MFYSALLVLGLYCLKFKWVRKNCFSSIYLHENKQLNKQSTEVSPYSSVIFKWVLSSLCRLVMESGVTAFISEVDFIMDFLK